MDIYDIPGKSVKYCSALIKGSFKPLDHCFKLVALLFEKAIFSFFNENVYKSCM